MPIPEDYEPYYLLYDLNLDPTELSRYERWDLDGNRVYRFANLQTPTCIYVEFDPEAVDE